MQHRITISVAVGVVVLLAGFGYFALTAVRDSRDAARDERLASAGALGVHVDDVVQRIAGRLATVAFRTATVWEDGEAARADLILGHRGLLFDAPLTLEDADGDVVWSSDDRMTVTLFAAEQVVATVDGETVVRPCLTQDGIGQLCLSSAVVVGGALVGALTMVVDIREEQFGFLPAASLAEGGEAELLGPGSTILAATAEPGIATDHSAALREAVDAGRPAVAIHDAGGSEHLVAYTPITTVPGWGVAVEQERDVALAVADRLERRFWIFAPLALVVAVAIAWLDVRQVVRPLRRLTRRANRMAGGDLASEIAVEGRGELGELAASFETMRVRLQRSLAEIEQRDRELEDRVRQRTEQVTDLYRELQAKEEARTQLLDKVIHAQEEERARIARELHDDAAQSLAAVAMELESAARPDTDVAEARQRLERARELATRTITDVRHLIADLRPANLDDLGLVAAIRLLGEERLEAAGVDVILTATGMEERLPPTVEIGLYRIIQEAITNIVRHAGASAVTIDLLREGDRVTVAVADDGRGFDLPAQWPVQRGGRGLGILGMQERVALLGGEFEIESTLTVGTSVRASVPLEGNGSP